MNNVARPLYGVGFVHWLLISVLLFGAAITEASHFRFGHFTWEARPDVSPATADFAMTVAFRSSAFGHPKIGQTFRPGSFQFGDGRGGSHYYKVIARNLQEDWIVGRAIQLGSGEETIRHTYPSPNNGGSPWLARFESCCKIGAIRNGGSSSWRVFTRVNLDAGNSSPVSNLPPIVRCAKYDCRFIVPAVDPDGDRLTWRMSTQSESAIRSIPSGMNVDRASGLFTWQGASSFSNGLYTVQVTIEDRDEHDAIKSTTAIDFLINLQDQGANAWPEFDHPPTPEAGSVITAAVGQPLTLTVQATDADSNDTVFLNHVGLPNAASFEQTVSGGSVGVAQLQWTPGATDIGEHIVTFLANDNRGGASMPVSVIIKVIKPAISDVRIISTITGPDITVDNTSFSLAPDSVVKEDGQTVITWTFDTFSVGQLENLAAGLKLFNVAPGEQRLVTERLDIFYKNIDGEPVHQVLGEQWVKVAPALTDIDVDTDKAVYKPSEVVAISSWLTNLSDVSVDALASLVIVDSQHNPVADLGSHELTIMAPGEQRYLPDTSFDAAGVYAGSYQVVARIIDENGSVLRQASAAFSITTESGEFLNVGALSSTDRPVYQAWDQAIISLRAQNLAQNANFEGGEGRLSIYRPNGELLAEQSYTLNSLAPLGHEDRQYVLRLIDREPGDYDVQWQIKRDGELMANSQTAFTVERAELQSLLGKVELEFYPTGEAKSCHFDTTNRSQQTVTANLIYQIVSLDDGSLLHEFRQRDIDLESDAVHLYQLLLSDPPAYGAYGCVLMAEIDGELLELDAAGFEVAPPNLDIRLQTAQRGWLLILLDEATSPHDDTDAAVQELYLEQLLDSHRWRYTLVDNAGDFEVEFNSGLYSAIALLSSNVTLNPRIEQLLVEAQYSGTGILVGGSWNRRNSQLERALGVKLIGRNNQASEITLVNDVIIEPVVHHIAVSQGLLLTHCDATVWATFNGGWINSADCAPATGPAAATAAAYGEGHHAYFSFDILDAATRHQSLHEQLLLSALVHIQPRRWPVAPGRVIPVELFVENLSRKAAVDVSLHLPDGGEIIDTDNVVRVAEDTWLWQRDFSAPADDTKIFYIRLPDEVLGEIGLEVDIDAGLNRNLMVDDSDKLIILGQLLDEQPDAVAGILLQQLEQQHPGDGKYDFIAGKIESAVREINKGKPDQAIKSLLLAVDEVAPGDNSLAIELRLLLDSWLYQLQRAL